MKTLGVIPARMASTRFPGKPLTKIAGKSMIERVYERAGLCKHLDHLLVATDHKDIFTHCEKNGINVVMTSASHVSGFDRICEVNSTMQGYTHIVNIQGDEPLLNPDVISQTLDLFSDERCDIATAAVKIESEQDFLNENIVKVVTDVTGKAMYFSRSAIPFYRNKLAHQVLAPLKHIGLYAYTTTALARMQRLAPAPHEQAESLEQLRFLYNGFNIFVTVTEQDSIGVDTPEDVLRVEKILGYQN